MPAGDAIGLVLTALLVGAAAGGAAAIAVAGSRRRREERRRRQLEACARWLAARRTLTRASISLVAAFRSLADQRRDSDYFQLRMDEAQRCRASWGDAMRELDRAEADLIVWSGPSGTDEPWTRVERAGGMALQVAIDGTEADVEALFQALHDADRHAAELVQATAGGLDAPVRVSRLPVALRRLTRWIGAIVDHWSR